MSIQHLDFRVPSLDEPRMEPCRAGGTGPGAQECGATPASLWLRYCLNNHRRRVRLCGTHAAMTTRGLVACTECLDKGTSAQAMISPADLILLGHAGGA
jgi:hypothetical protein